MLPLCKLFLLILFPFQLSFQTVEALRVVYLTPLNIKLMYVKYKYDSDPNLILSRKKECCECCSLGESTSKSVTWASDYVGR